MMWCSCCTSHSWMHSPQTRERYPPLPALSCHMSPPYPIIYPPLPSLSSFHPLYHHPYPPIYPLPTHILTYPLKHRPTLTILLPSNTPYPLFNSPLPPPTPLGGFRAEGWHVPRQTSQGPGGNSDERDQHTGLGHVLTR